MAETEYQRMRREQQESMGPVKPKNGTRQRFAPEVAKARNAERVRRNQEARRRANLILSKRYEDEFTELLKSELQGVNDERGPLPGDRVEGA